MTKNGKAAKALSIGIIASFIGTFISIIIATLLSGTIASFALVLGPWEYFSLCFMAISLVVGLSNGSIFKGLLGAFLGVWLATIGSDSVTNTLRFTFGNFNLYGGIPVVCLLLGTFAMQQVANGYARGNQEMPTIDTKSLKGFGLTVKDFSQNAKVIVVSFLIGLWIGFLPGMGSGVSNMVAYGQAKKMSKHPELFGTGYEAGVWATEVANNASVGGALIPLISLGIPGDGTCVLLLSAMTIHGLTPGPMFIYQNPGLAYLIFATVLVSAVLIAVIELLTKRWFPYILKAPYHYLYSGILTVCFVGAFAASTSMFAVYIMIFFGLVGVVLEYCNIPMGPMMLAYILGANLETYFRRGLSYSRGDVTSFVTHPISAIFLLIGLYSLISPLVKYMIKASKAKKLT